MSLLKKVKDLFEKNHREGINFDYTCPSPKMYPHQWLWDSSFHSIVLSHLDPKRAQKEIGTLLSKQRSDGFVACVSIWKKRHPLEMFMYITQITQPPVIPLSVEIIFNKNRDINFVKEVYPKLKKFMEWLYQNRDRNKNGLLEIVHPWEDGDDANPSFDKQVGFVKPMPSTPEYFFKLFRILVRYYLVGWNEEKIFKIKAFRAETVLFNSIYARSLLAMATLAELLGKVHDQETFKTNYQSVKNSLIKHCWNKKDRIFYDLDNNSKQSGVKNISSLMALVLPDLPKHIYKPLIENHLLNKKEFWTEFPVPSVSISEKTFNPGKSLALWRGPTWVNTNWFLENALKNYGYKTEANFLTNKTVSMIEKNSFWEFYNPFTGEGYGQPNFGWSTLVLDM